VHILQAYAHHDQRDGMEGRDRHITSHALLSTDELYSNWRTCEMDSVYTLVGMHVSTCYLLARRFLAEISSGACSMLCAACQSTVPPARRPTKPNLACMPIVETVITLLVRPCLATLLVRPGLEPGEPKDISFGRLLP